MAQVQPNTRKPAAASKGAEQEKLGKAREVVKSLNTDAIKAKGKEAYESLTDEQKKNLGSMSSKIAGLYPLFSPTTTQTTKGKKGFKVLGMMIKNVSDEPVEIITGTVIGRQASGLIDVDFHGDNKQVVTLKPGDEFPLSYAECFVNFFRPEYAKQLTGKNEKGLVYTFRYVPTRKSTSKIPNIGSGTMYAKDSEKAGEPSPNITELYQAIATKDEGKPAVAKKGFERFAKYLEPKKQAGGASKGARSTKTQNYDFLAMQGEIDALLQ